MDFRKHKFDCDPVDQFVDWTGLVFISLMPRAAGNAERMRIPMTR